MAGLKIPVGTAEDSCSLTPAFGGKGFERDTPLVHHSANGTFALRYQQWKLVLGNGSGGREVPVGRPVEEPYQLFDLSHDLSERYDVAAQHPDRVQSLTDQLEVIRANASK